MNTGKRVLHPVGEQRKRVWHRYDIPKSAGGTLRLHSLSGLLEEARFWVRILKEHALFIFLGLPCDREELREEAQAFVSRFQNLQDQLSGAVELTDELRQEIIEAVEDIIEFKERILRMLIQCELTGSNYPLLIDHITREARHFLELLTNTQEPPPNPLLRLLDTEVFWLRIMKEHVEFLIHLLDPSQRVLLEQARDFRETFSTLLEEARDLDSMAESEPESFHTVLRFTEAVVASTVELRNFKAAAHEMAVLCQLLSIIPDPLLVDHIRREADKFLEEVRELQAIISQLS